MKKLGLMQEKKPDLNEADKYECHKCGNCCLTFKFSMAIPDDSLLLEFLKTRHRHPQGTWYMNEKGHLVMIIQRKCEHLTAGALCGIYSDRPVICRGYTCKRHPKSQSDKQTNEKEEKK